MNKLNQPMPEAWYKISQDITHEELSRKFESNEFVVGKVTYWNSSKKCFEIDLGNNLVAIMPIDEASIYPTSFPDGKLKPEGFTLVGKTICAKIITILPDKIVLSRKANMLEAFKTICNFENKIVNCYIKSAKGTMIFTDIGHGISGLLHVTELCSCRLNDVRDLGIAEKSFINAKINSVDPTTFHISLGYKELFENLSDQFNYDDVIEAIALNPVQNTKDAYFCYINPNTSAILNSVSNLIIPYGSKVIARVRASNPDKLKLSFLSFS